MSEIVSSPVPREAAQARGTLTKEQQLRGVIRVLINKNQRLQQPVLAAKRLAKHCQFLKDEVGRLKERSYNYETGMTLAERRAAQLQQDLYKLQDTKQGAGKLPKKEVKLGGSPFYLPASIQQLVDRLTTKNVSLMRSLQRAIEGDLKTAEIVEQSIKLESVIKALQEELGLKTSLLEHYESLVSESKPKDDAARLATSIIEQRKECAQLKTKLRSYESYVRHLRDKNTAIMESVMDGLDKANRQPMESTDDYERGASGFKSKEGSQNPSTAASQDTSRNASRRESLKDTDVQTVCELQSTGIQTDSGVSCSSSTRGSIDETEIEMMPTDNEACQKELEVMKNLLSERESNEKILLEKLEDVEEICRAMSMENESSNKKIEVLTQELLKEKQMKKDLLERIEDSEAILKLMQERVDSVNQEHAEVNCLKDQLKESEQKVADMPLMQQFLKDYEEEIKAYAVERNQLISKQDELTKERDNATRQVKQLEHQIRSFAASKKMEAAQQQQEQQQDQQRQLRVDQQRSQVQEPWQQSQWKDRQFLQRGVVADGFSPRYQFDSPPDDLIHLAQRNRRLQEATPRQRGYEKAFRSPDPGVMEEDIDADYKNYVESGTVKCENCGERYPNSLIQDHFRDCSRDNSG